MRAQIRNDTVPATESARDATYLVLDLARRRLRVEISGVVLREYLLQVLTDSSELQAVVQQWHLLPAIEHAIGSVYLLSAAEALSRQEVEVIAEEAHLDAHLIQRYIPSRLVMVTREGLAIQIESVCEDAHSFMWPRTREAFSRLRRAVSGRKTLTLRLAPDDAMSLYGLALARPGIIMP